MTTYEICKVPSYEVNYKRSQKCVKAIDTICALINTDIHAHERLFKDDNIKLLIDVDKISVHRPDVKPVEYFKNILKYSTGYVGVDAHEISYTCSPLNPTGSYHVVIPKYFMKSSLQKLYWTKFKNMYGYGDEIDSGILGKDTWFRLPNQTNNDVINKVTEEVEIQGKPYPHEIIQGEIKDFILKYCEEATELEAVDIQTISLDAVKKKKKTTKALKIVEKDDTDNESNDTEPETDCDAKDKMDWVKEMLHYAENECYKKYVATHAHLEWIKFGGMLRSAFGNENAFLIWKTATLQNGSTDKKNEYKAHFKFLKVLETDKEKAFNTLRKWAKIESPEIVKEYLKNKKEAEKSLNVINSYNPVTDKLIFLREKAIQEQCEYNFAELLNELKKDKFKFVEKNQIYTFNDKTALWNSDYGITPIRSAISVDLVDFLRERLEELSEEACSLCEGSDEFLYNKKLTKHISDIIIKLYRTNDKNNIARELCELVHDPYFEKDMNKQVCLLPLQNKKILNMQTLEVIERTMDHKFNYECKANYVEMSEEEEADIKKYFMDLYLDEPTMKCMLDIIKSTFTGNVLRYIFFHTGEGRNGKSILFLLLNEIFQKNLDIVNKSVILKSKTNTHLNTEMEKLDKARCAYITELEEEDELNIVNIKAISGKDPINLRTICKSDTTIIPTSTLHILTNELPKFKAEQAIMDRLIVCPYENRFEVDSAFKDKMMAKLDLVFSYIMKYGEIKDTFDLTPRMISSKNEYQEDNTKDNLAEYLSANWKIIPDEEYDGKKHKILQTTLRTEYKNWLKVNHKPADMTNDKKFTRLFKNKYGIPSWQSNHKNYYTHLERVEVEEKEA